MARTRDDDERPAKRRRHRTVRLFVAVYPPVEIAARMLDLVETDELPPVRLVPVEQVHLTLQFIGDTAPGDVDRIRESIGRATGGVHATALEPLDLIALPEKGPARLLAIRTDRPPPLLEIEHRLAVRLARHVRDAHAREFLPHLTVCRFRSPARILRVVRAAPLPSFPVREIKLMRSVLHPSGARHDEVAPFALTPR